MMHPDSTRTLAARFIAISRKHRRQRGLVWDEHVASSFLSPQPLEANWNTWLLHTHTGKWWSSNIYDMLILVKEGYSTCFFLIWYPVYFWLMHRSNQNHTHVKILSWSQCVGAKPLSISGHVSRGGSIWSTQPSKLSRYLELGLFFFGLLRLHWLLSSRLAAGWLAISRASGLTRSLVFGVVALRVPSWMHWSKCRVQLNKSTITLSRIIMTVCFDESGSMRACTHAALTAISDAWLWLKSMCFRQGWAISSNDIQCMMETANHKLVGSSLCFPRPKLCYTCG